MIEQIASEVYFHQNEINDILRGDSYRVPFVAVRTDFSPPLGIAHNDSYTVTQFSTVVQYPGNAFVVNAQNGTISVREGIVLIIAGVTASPASSDGMLRVQAINTATGVNEMNVYVPVIIPQGNVSLAFFGSFTRAFPNSTVNFRMEWYSKTGASIAVIYFYARMLWFPRF